jgi:hypothetical protein
MLGTQNANWWKEDQENTSVKAAILDRCSLIPHSSHWPRLLKLMKAFRLCGYPTTRTPNDYYIQLTLMFSCNRAYTSPVHLLRRNISNPPLHVCRSHSQTPTRFLLSNYMSTAHTELRTECWLKWSLFVLLPCSIHNLRWLMHLLFCSVGMDNGSAWTGKMCV